MDAICSVDYCDRTSARRGYCQTHYKRVLKTGSPGPPIKEQHRRPEECIVGGCTRDANGSGCGHGYCASHYARWRKTGDPGPGEIRDWQLALGSCSVEDCESSPHARGLCSMHHARWLKHGDPGSAELQRTPAGPCTLSGCARPRFSSDYCRLHYHRWKRYGNPGTVQYGGFRGSQVGYQGAHLRHCAELGRADSYPCSFCDHQAKDWAYSGTDPAAKYDSKSGRAYSLDPLHYLPLCRSCHKLFDAPLPTVS